MDGEKMFHEEKDAGGKANPLSKSPAAGSVFLSPRSCARLGVHGARSRCCWMVRVRRDREMGCRRGRFIPMENADCPLCEVTGSNPEIFRRREGWHRYET